MFKRFLPNALALVCLIVFINTGCTKLDTTSLGTGLIPAVDNINTKADTLSIETTQNISNDSFQIFKSNNHALGTINDPIFGMTQANIYLQPQPSFYPYYFGNAGDTLKTLDSVVLTLAYVGAWGDTNQNQVLSVYPITDSIWANTPYQQKRTNYKPTIDQSQLLGSKTVDIPTLKNGFKIAKGQDSVYNQIRIKLSTSYANSLFNSDTITGSLRNSFKNDTLFRNRFKGLAVIPSGGNALMYISLSDAKTRLEVHFSKKSSSGVTDTVFNSLVIVQDNAVNNASSSSNYVLRTYPPAIQNPAPMADALYLQTGPGTYATLKIPALSNYSNRIIHRAFITVEQILENPDTDSIFSVPPYMYLDIIDTGVLKYKPLYFDLNLNTRYDPDFKTGLPYFPSNANIDYTYFGGYARKKTNSSGKSVYYYDINITRYLQQLVSKGTPNYSFRLFPGYSVTYPQFGTTTLPASSIPLSNPLALGRIKVKSGYYPDTSQRMKLVVIYSEIK